MKIPNLFALLLLLIPGSLWGQISIEPSAVYINPEFNNGILYVKNESDEKREIHIGYYFGYIDMDSNGLPYVRTDDSLSENKYSVIPYIKAYPPRLFLEPGEKKAVKFAVRDMSGLEDGMYWARVSILTKVAEEPIKSAEDTVQGGMLITTELVTAVVMPKGKLSTNISIENVNVQTDSAAARFFISFVKGGNAPFLGNLAFMIENEKGEQVFEMDEIPLVFYFSGTQQFPIPIKKFTNGNYKLTIKIDNKRNDFPDFILPKFEPFEKSFNFSIKK